MDGQTLEAIESQGLMEWLEGIRKDLRNKTYKPLSWLSLTWRQRSLRYLNGGTLSPFPTEAGHSRVRII